MTSEMIGAEECRSCSGGSLSGTGVAMGGKAAVSAAELSKAMLLAV